MKLPRVLAALATLTACHGSATTTAVDGGATPADGGPGDTGATTPHDATIAQPDARRSDAGPPPSVPVDVLTQHNDIARTGVNASETILTPGTVSAATFGKLFTVPVDGLISAQPLVVSSYAIGGQTRNAVFVTTAHDSVYAFDADTAEALWHVSLGTPLPSTQVGPVDAAVGTFNVLPELGILSTPVIDRANDLLYVTSTNYHGAGVPQSIVLHVLALGTGAEMKGSPVDIAASVPGTGDGTSTVTFVANMETQRPGLLLLDGTVYLAFASHGDYRPFHGFVLAYRYDTTLHTLQQTHAFTTTADGYGGGIWAGGQGIAADSANNLYVMVANGTTNVQDGGQSYSESFLKLTPSLSVVDWFVVSGWEGMNTADWDVGSGGPVLIPGTHLMAGGGKQGVLYVVDTENLGHYAADLDGGVVQSFQATDTPFEGIFGGPVAWNGDGTTRVYLWGASGPLKEYVLANGVLDPTPVAKTPFVSAGLDGPGAGDPVGALSISSSGSSGILWASVPLGNPVDSIVLGEMYALDAVTLDVLWTSEQVDARDQVGNHAKFVPPTVANGKVYLATQSNALLVYGLLASAKGDE